MQPKIRWTKKQQNRLTNSARSFNRKIEKIRKDNPSLSSFLPEKVKVSELKQSINTNRDLNNRLRSLERIKRQGALLPVQNQQGISLTKYELNEINLAVRRVNRARAKELAQIAPSTEKGTMGTYKTNSLKPKKFDFENIDFKDFEAFKTSVNKEDTTAFRDLKALNYQNNYIEGLYHQYGSTPEVEELVNFVGSLEPEEFVEEAEQNPILQIAQYYIESETYDILHSVMEEWIKKFGKNRWDEANPKNKEFNAEITDF